MSNYTRITRTDFETTLADLVGADGFARVPATDLRGTRELVYDIDTGYDDFTVRVFSSIHVGDETGRDCGNDSIKTVLWSHHADRPVDGMPRTHRIETWADNLAPKIDALLGRVADHADEIQDEKDALLAHDFDTDEGDAGTIAVVDAYVDSYDRVRVALDGDTYAAKDLIKFDWNETHHDFDGDTKTWHVDAAALDTLHAKLADAGFALVDGAAADETDDVLADLAPGETVVVTYAMKNRDDAAAGDRTKTVEGVIVDVRVEEAWAAFKRTTDGHLMTIRDADLFTSGSHFPFMGTVETIETQPEA